MTTLEEILQNGRLRPGDVLLLKAHAQRIAPEILGAYLTNIPSSESIRPHVEQLFLVNSYLGELERRKDTEHLKEIQVLLEEGKSLSDIITHSALILSDTLPKEEYQRSKQRAFAALKTEIRKRQRKITQARMSPFRAFSAAQYYARLAIFGGLVSLAGFTHAYFNNIDTAALRESAKLEQLRQTFSSVREDLVNPEKEKQFYAWRIAKRDFEHMDLKAREDLKIINEREVFFQRSEQGLNFIDDGAIEQKSNFIDAEAFVQKRDRLAEFIEKYNGSYVAIEASFQFAELVREGQKIYGRTDKANAIELEALEAGRHIPYFITSKRLRRIYNHILEEKLEQTGNFSLANDKALDWLKKISSGGDITATEATLVLADLYAQGNGNNGAEQDPRLPAQDKGFAVELYTKVAKETTIPEQYSMAQHAILVLEGKNMFRRWGGVSIDMEDRLRAYKDVAAYTRDEKRRNAMLMSAAAVYYTMKEYTRANAYYEYIVETSSETEATGRTKAREKIENPYWALFWGMGR